MMASEIDGRTFRGKRRRGESKLLANGLIHGKPYVDHRGYLRAGDPRNGNKARPVHRIVMEHHIGRPLLRSEHVHHINHDPCDNRIENLQIIERRAHIELHATPLVPVTCPNCGKERQLRKQEADTYAYDSCKQCVPVFLSKTLRARNALRYFWIVWATNELIGPFETRKEATKGAPVVNKRNGRALIVVAIKTGEVKPASKRRALPDDVVQRPRQLAERLRVG